MFRFAHPDYLYFLLLAPLVVGWFIYNNYRKRAALKKFGDPTLLKDLMPGASNVRPVLKFSLLLFAIISLLFVLARPQFGTRKETAKRKGIEIMAVLDISNSMLTQDVQPSRLERAKKMIIRWIDEMDNDKMGLVIFAGKAYIQIPMTSDYQAAKIFVSSISPSLIPQQGTAIGAAISLASRSFSTQDERARAIILITDGEDHEDNAIAAAKEAREKGILVHVIGIGSAKGALVPVEGKENEFHKDQSGNPVVSKLNEEMSQQIAKAGGGIYVRADNTNDAIIPIQKEMDKIAKGEVEAEIYSQYDEQFHVVTWIVIVLLLTECCILERKNKYLSKIKLF